MLYLDGLIGLITLGLWIFCLIDAITTDESSCRNLGKVMWIVLIIFLPLVGSIAWLIAGRPQEARSVPYKGNYGPVVSDRERPGWHPSSSPDDDQDFLRSVRARAEEQRRAYRESQQREIGEGDNPTT
ncbi:MAG: PLD nuclease N-terminal domain-containing protein [Aeromicrobium sp.]